MALTFIYGNSGSGKSEYIYQQVSRMASDSPYKRFYVVVPEQFTMYTQKRLVEHSKRGVIMNTDVVSFQRLAYRVFDELGIHHTVLEETGKNLVLRRIVEKHEDELSVLKGNLTRMGYIGEMKSLISEFMQYGISTEELDDFIKTLNEGSTLAKKLQDILAIYRAFDQYLGEGYVTAERVLEELMNAADQSDLLKGAVFVFDGYTGFTPVQMKLLKKLMTISGDIYITVTLDQQEELYHHAQIQDLFYMSQHMVQSLVRAAADTKLEVADPICIEKNSHSRLANAPVLAHLESALFRPRVRVYEEDCKDAIQLYSLANPKAELTFAASKICELIREKGYRYGDIAIVSGNVETYASYADQIFDMYDIPYFVDTKLSVLYHPFIELIRSALEIVERDYSYESVFRYLRTGLTGHSMDEIDRLENYCIEKGIRGAAKWKKHFLSPTRRHGRVRMKEEDLQKELAVLNQIRESVWTQTKGLYEVFNQKDHTVTEQTKALYDFICKLKVEEQLVSAQEKFEEAGKEILASQYRQIYKVVIDLFDKMVDLLGDEQMSVQDYADVLEAGFSEAKIGSIPPGSDCVILGDIERTRLDGIKMLFFLGVNDGLIPKNTDRGSILSQFDREMMKEHHVELSPTARDQVFLQRFYLYLNLTKPSEGLYLSFSRMDGEGKTVRTSYLVGVLQKLFPALETEILDEESLLVPATAKSSMNTYLNGLILARKGQIMPEWKALHRWFSTDKNWSGLIEKLMDANFGVYDEETLDRDLAKLVYGAVMTNSVTRLELFAKCAYAHFIDYGLKLAKREEFSFEALDMGTMFHDILFRYSQKLEQQYDWADITQTQQEELLREAMEESVLSMPNEALLQSSRSAYTLERIYRIMKRSVWAITEQMRRGDFLPEGYEVEFTQTSKLDGDSLMRTVGKVDRIDTYEEDGKVYVKIVDYKSGKTTFKLLQLYYGMQLQLVMYLNAAMEKIKVENPTATVLPGGILYYHLDDPMVEGEYSNDAEIQEAILKSLKMDGLVSMDETAYLHMDKTLLQTSKSNVIPIELKKDQTLSSRGTSAASVEQFDMLSSYVKEKVDATAGQIASGKIAVAPYQMGDKTGCDYCDYRSVCGFDQRIPGYEYKKQYNLSPDDVWAKIAEEIAYGRKGE